MDYTTLPMYSACSVTLQIINEEKAFSREDLGKCLPSERQHLENSSLEFRTRVLFGAVLRLGSAKPLRLGVRQLH